MPARLTEAEARMAREWTPDKVLDPLTPAGRPSRAVTVARQVGRRLIDDGEPVPSELSEATVWRIAKCVVKVLRDEGLVARPTPVTDWDDEDDEDDEDDGNDRTVLPLREVRHAMARLTGTASGPDVSWKAYYPMRHAAEFLFGKPEVPHVAAKTLFDLGVATVEQADALFALEVDDTRLYRLLLSRGIKARNVGPRMLGKARQAWLARRADADD